MGGGIAQVAARTGIEVVLVDAAASRRSAGATADRRALDRLVEKGKIDGRRARRDRWRASAAPTLRRDLEAATSSSRRRPRTRTEAGDLRDAGPGLPQRHLWRPTRRRSPSRCSARRTTRPERVIGMHFMNPVPLMKLVEIVRGLATGDDDLRGDRGAGRAVRQEMVTVARHPRLHRQPHADPDPQRGLLRAAGGARPVEDIDTAHQARAQPPDGAVRAGGPHRPRHCLAIAEVLHRELGDDKYRPRRCCASTSPRAGWGARPAAASTATRRRRRPRDRSARRP